MAFTPVLISSDQLTSVNLHIEHQTLVGHDDVRYQLSVTNPGFLRIYGSTDDGSTWSILDDGNYPGTGGSTTGAKALYLFKGAGTAGSDLLRTEMADPGSPSGSGGVIEFCEFDVGALAWGAVTHIGGGFNTHLFSSYGADESPAMHRFHRQDGTEIVIKQTNPGTFAIRTGVLQLSSGTWTQLALYGTDSPTVNYQCRAAKINEDTDTIYLYMVRGDANLHTQEYTTQNLICVTIASDNTISSEITVDTILEFMPALSNSGQPTPPGEPGNCAFNAAKTELAIGYGWQCYTQWDLDGMTLTDLQELHVARADLSSPLAPTFTVDTIIVGEPKYLGSCNDIWVSYEKRTKITFDDGNAVLSYYGEDIHAASNLKVYWLDLIPYQRNSSGRRGKIKYAERASGTWGAPVQLWPDPDSSSPDIGGLVVASTGEAVVPPPVLALACPITTVGTIGVFFTSTLIASGGTPPYTFMLLGGSLPPGLTLDALTGIISGTPTNTGTYTYEVQVDDSLGNSVTVICNITINGPPTPALVVLCPPANLVLIGKPYSSQIVVVGGTPPYTYAITAGSLPTGLTLNTSTGVISGTPTVAGTYSYTIRVTDANGLTASVSCAIAVSNCPGAL